MTTGRETKTIWFDVDGVLLDYTRAFLDFTGLSSRGIEYHNLTDYDLTKLFDTPDECHRVMLQFALSDEFRDLPSHIDGQFLWALKNLGHSLKVITKLPAPPKARLNRLMNLSEKFGPVFDEVVFTTSECKLDFLKKRNDPNAIILEDNPDFLRKAEDSILVGLLDQVPAPHPEVMAIIHPYNAHIAKELTLIRKYESAESAIITLLLSEV